MRLPKSLLNLSFFSLALLLSGCTHNMVRDFAGSSMVSFGNDYITPWFMASDDTDVMCAMGEGMGAMTFPLAPATDPMVPMLTLASGMCADERAKDEELRYLRALRKNDSETAQDARTQQKRWTEVAARRQYFGYQATVRHFGEPGGDCPEFEDRNDQMSYMFGLFGGFQAFQLDLSNGGGAGVPLSTMPNAIKGLSCLNSDEFWGLPEAILAMVDIMKAKVGNETAVIEAGEARLAAAAAVGEKQGVRMVHLLQATLYSMQGEENKLKDVIRKHVKMKQTQPAEPSQRLLDEMATRGIRLISDRLWTLHTGQRTPYNQLGRFWDDSAGKTDAPDIDDLL